jgi:hypothetical protein
MVFSSAVFLFFFLPAVLGVEFLAEPGHGAVEVVKVEVVIGEGPDWVNSRDFGQKGRSLKGM